MANKRIRKELIEGMEALTEIGAVKGVTMRTFKEQLLPEPPAYIPEEIKAIRAKFGISQAVFADLLNVSVSTLQKWEQGRKKPSATAYKLLEIVNSNGLNILINT